MWSGMSFKDDNMNVSSRLQWSEWILPTKLMSYKEKFVLQWFSERMFYMQVISKTTHSYW